MCDSPQELLIITDFPDAQTCLRLRREARAAFGSDPLQEVENVTRGERNSIVCWYY
jgi:predicted 2-oxoglutarate/Fe(II)-dependent dioxygenase YbiX